MASLKEKGIALLGSAVVDMKTAASTTIFTVPTGKTCRIAFVVVRDPTASLAGGTSYSVTNFRQTFDLSSMTGGATKYLLVQAADLTSYTETATDVAVQLTVTTGSSAVANATIDVFGYLT